MNITSAKRIKIWNTELWNEENAQYTPESVAAIMEELNF